MCYNKIVHLLNVLLIRVHKNNTTKYTTAERHSKNIFKLKCLVLEVK